MLGPVMLDLHGSRLTSEERDLLRHPLVGGVLLFSRNHVNADQLHALVGEIRAARSAPVLVAVDQEGGRVQRLRTGFTRLPAAAALGRRYDADPARARRLARTLGWLLATELGAAGIDFSFAPVLDLGSGGSRVIGDRALHRHPDAVAELATAMTAGMGQAGMAAVGKHFPGHGGVVADSHLELPVDRRSFSTLAMGDLVPFERLIRHGIKALMPAHVIYEQIDERPAGFSQRWLGQILRKDLEFTGAVFSDDLSMAGASWAGSALERAEAALDAGCDMVLVCNDRDAAVQILDGLAWKPDPVAMARLAPMHARSRPDAVSDAELRAAVAAVTALEREPELGFADDDAPA